MLSYADLLTQQKTDLAKQLELEKTKDLQTLDDKLAARGISRGGGVEAGSSDIVGKYLNALTTGNLNLEQNAQNNALAQADRDLAQKYYDLAMSKYTDSKGSTVKNYMPGQHYATGGFTGLIPAASYDSTAGGSTVAKKSQKNVAQDAANLYSQLWG